MALKDTERLFDRLRIRLDSKSDIACGKSVKKHAFDEKTNDLQVEKDLKRFREIRPGYS